MVCKIGASKPVNSFAVTMIKELKRV